MCGSLRRQAPVTNYREGGKMTRKLAAMLALAVMPSLAVAQTTPPPTAQEDIDNTQYGGRSAVFLTLPGDARGAALGGSFASLVNDLSTVYYTPAGVAMVGQNQGAFSDTECVAGTRQLSAGIGWSLLSGAWGVGVSVVNCGFSAAQV